MSVFNENCLFCKLSGRRVMCENALALAICDAYPISNGHALIIPRRHVTDLFDLPEEDLVSVFTLVRDMKAMLATKYSPSGFNVGVNIGRDAGQTVMHAHVHVIPRYPGACG
jgi:diadenosine tetraphosphate (Ap4A) HIT family hydrolase